MMQGALGPEKKSIVMGFARDHLKYADEQAKEMLVKASDTAHKALRDIEKAKNDLDKQLKYAIRALKCADTLMECTRMRGMYIFLGMMAFIFKIIYESINVAAQIIDEDLTSNVNIGKIEDFKKNMSTFSEKIEFFNNSKKIILKDDLLETVKQYVTALKASVSEMRQAPAIKYKNASHIVYRIEITFCGLQHIDCIKDHPGLEKLNLARFIELREAFAKAKANTMDTKFEINDVIKILNNQPSSQRIEQAKFDIKYMKIYIAKMKEKSNEMNDMISKMVKMIAEEEQAKTDSENRIITGNFVGDTSQEINIKISMLRGWIIEYRRYAIEVMEDIYQIELDATDLEQKFNDGTQDPTKQLEPAVQKKLISKNNSSNVNRISNKEKKIRFSDCVDAKELR